MASLGVMTFELPPITGTLDLNAGQTIAQVKLIGKFTETDGTIIVAVYMNPDGTRYIEIADGIFDAVMVRKVYNREYKP